MSARGATRHWRNQRLTAVALVPLGLWFLFGLLSLPDLSRSTVAGWLSHPMQAGLMLLFGWCALWHSAQGVQVVVDDYATGRRHGPARWTSRLLHLAAAATLGWAVVSIAMAGGA